MKYRQAAASDVAAIAGLHADSWQRHYRGAYLDSYLDGDVLADRMTEWAARLSGPQAGLHTVVADLDGEVTGFAHVIFDADPAWGAYLDALHGRHDLKRRGIGGRLIAEAARAVARRSPATGLYLEQNAASRAFYAAHGGRRAGRELSGPFPGGGYAFSLRYAWPPARVVLDVPEDATELHFGALLNGGGAPELSQPRFEEASDAIPTTGVLADEPQALDFGVRREPGRAGPGDSAAPPARRPAGTRRSGDDAAGAVAGRRERAGQSGGDVVGAERAAGRVVVDAVTQEPGRLRHGGPVEDAQVRVRLQRLGQGRVPGLLAGVGPRARGQLGAGVDPQDRLAVGGGHHLVDPRRQADGRAGLDVGHVVGAEGEDPAAPVPVRPVRAGHLVAVDLSGHFLHH
jgi:GNAT superfamily N-acetyltransferase